MANIKGYLALWYPVDRDSCINADTPNKTAGYGDVYGSVYGGGSDIFKYGLAKYQSSCTTLTTHDGSNSLLRYSVPEGWGEDYGSFYGGFHNPGMLPRTASYTDFELAFELSALEVEHTDDNYDPPTYPKDTDSGEMADNPTWLRPGVHLLSRAFSKHNGWVGEGYVI